MIAVVRLFEWNPRRHRPRGPIGRVITYGPRLENFGDRLGPLVVGRLLRERGIRNRSRTGPRLFTVGSVLHFARTGDHVWGSGRNGKIEESRHRFGALHVTACRGPLTRRFLQERGIDAPAIYGDPGLLVAELFPEWRPATDARVGTVYVPNLNDTTVPPGLAVLSPRGEVGPIVERIASAELVIASSLHGVVIAEAFGVPARLVVPERESLFKYRDYFAGTGRPDEPFARSVEDALRLGPAPAPLFDREALVGAFPMSLWERAR